MKWIFMLVVGGMRVKLNAVVKTEGTGKKKTKKIKWKKNRVRAPDENYSAGAVPPAAPRSRSLAGRPPATATAAGRPVRVPVRHVVLNFFLNYFFIIFYCFLLCLSAAPDGVRIRAAAVRRSRAKIIKLIRDNNTTGPGRVPSYYLYFLLLLLVLFSVSV